MEYQDLKETYTLPDTPGVYFFIGSGRKILYIGKATSLRDRVKSYFTGDLEAARSAWIAEMVEKARAVKWEETDSVLEALLLEAQLIKKHAPPYNTEGKDDKSFNYLVITKEDFPRVLIVRGRDILKRKFPEGEIKYLYGPFPSGGMFKEALKIIRKIFPFRDKCVPNSGKPCFNRQIGLCPGVCSGEVEREEYARTIRHLKLFFEGKKKALIQQLEREMKAYAKSREFEKANTVKKTIFALNHIRDVALLKTREPRDYRRTYHSGKRPVERIEAYDVAHISGTSTVGVMTVVEEGEPKKSDYRKFKVREGRAGSDTDALKEVLRRRFGHDEWPLPGLIVIDGGKAQLNAARSVLAEYGYQIPLVSVVKNERHRPREILGDIRLRKEHEADIILANSEAHRFAVAYHRSLRSRRA